MSTPLCRNLTIVASEPVTARQDGGKGEPKAQGSHEHEAHSSHILAQETGKDGLARKSYDTTMSHRPAARANRAHDHSGAPWASIDAIASHAQLAYADAC